MFIPPEWLEAIEAPMINQSDLPFRILTRRYGATLAFTQMLVPEKILNDQDYFEFHRKGLGIADVDRPVFVQLCGNDPDIIVQAGKKFQNYCDGIDLNLGCPQRVAQECHFGGYLLQQKDWPVVRTIVSSMSRSFTVPVTAKIRLCQPANKTAEFARHLEAAGVSCLTLHARHVSAQRRRKGPADLDQVAKVKQAVHIPVISNGNVRLHEDVVRNKLATGADGIMVGEMLLANPCLFSGIIPDPVGVSVEYLNICEDYPGTASMESVRTHVRHIIENQCSRCVWYRKFRRQLGLCMTVDDVMHLLCHKVQRWREFPLINDEEEDQVFPVLDDSEYFGLEDLR
ncbi:FMN-linked oxidoreductase [Rickenella mellea]|uniref:tRNA-dihydrouridine(16/17) synthase [NAD(P)(+)] n=1 Tax=Rickenella mellea TaxID=50990 RepID=A0A4Y7Q8C9_9AGAM|nr:FMN-linked oxidoreductase [Rickenella mellea]